MTSAKKRSNEVETCSKSVSRFALPARDYNGPFVAPKAKPYDLFYEKRLTRYDVAASIAPEATHQKCLDNSSGRNMTDRQLVFEDFKEHVGSVFTLLEEGVNGFELKLDEASPLPSSNPKPGFRSPFSLIFLNTDGLLIPQRLYRMKHDGIGEVTIFIVPIGKDQRGVSYQAVFN